MHNLQRKLLQNNNLQALADGIAGKYFVFAPKNFSSQKWLLLMVANSTQVLRHVFGANTDRLAYRGGHISQENLLCPTAPHAKQPLSLYLGKRRNRRCSC
jgi:hypothetical protein